MIAVDYCAVVLRERVPQGQDVTVEGMRWNCGLPCGFVGVYMRLVLK